ncbi:hypothetical protein [Ferruginibacter sp.]
MAVKDNQLVINLGNFNLTDDQRKTLQDAIHATMAKQIKAIGKKKKQAPAPVAAPPPKALTGNAAVAAVAPVAATKTANLTVSFTSVAIGKSKLTASFGNQSKTITQSDTITFTGLSRGDSISIDGTSLGSTTITIDINANPAQMNFTPGNFDDNFLIR